VLDRGSISLDPWKGPLLGRNVRRIRGERQMSLGALARQAGLAKQTLANLESGTGNPTVETLLAVAGASTRLVDPTRPGMA